MTAKELINHLKTLSPDTRICVNGYEDGVNYVKLIREAKILKDANSEWYYGNHQEVLDDDSKHFDEIVWIIQ
jgi:hypothetical protein